MSLEKLVRLGIFFILTPVLSPKQVKPLLQVTRQDEEIQTREAALQKAKEQLTRAEQDYTELDKKHAQVNKPHPHCASYPSQFCLCLSYCQSGPHSSPLLRFCHIVAAGGKGSAG